MPTPENLKATAILDYEEPLISQLAVGLRRQHGNNWQLLQAAHRNERG